MIQVLADQEIAGLELFNCAQIALQAIDAKHICPANLVGVDALLTRSVTKLDASLLNGSSIQFVASPSSGFDQFDTRFLTSAGIRSAYAPACNATSVADYVIASVAYLEQIGINLTKIGVIGVGQCGSRVLKRLQALGYDVVSNDPIRQLTEPAFLHTDIWQMADCDLITLHTPLTQTGRFASKHLINSKIVAELKPGCVLLNAARGAVVDNQALLKHGRHLTLCLDVWENEPNIDLNLLKLTTLATPHIAGHAIEAKLRGTAMIYQQFCHHFKLDVKPNMTTPAEHTCLMLTKQQILELYDPKRDDLFMRECVVNANNVADGFEYCRRHYGPRHEFGYQLSHHA